MSRIDRITREVKKYDRHLYCALDGKGRPAIYRKGYKWTSFMYNDCVIHHQIRDDYNVMTLTHDWSQRGQVVDWGLEPIMQRLRAIDCWQSDSEINAFEKTNEEYEAKKDRHLTNKTEDIAREMAPVFKKTFSDVNTASMAKLDNRRNRDKKRKG